MEKQNAECNASRPIEIREMYDIRQRNYDWEDFKYQMPRKYTYVPPSFVRSGGLFGTKNNYLDDLQKEKKKIPGPSHYKINEIKERPQSGKMERSKRVTMSEQVNAKSEKQNIPGPGAYFKRPQSALTTTLSVSQKQKALIERPHYLNEVEYLASNSPGVGSYNLSQPKHVGGPKLLKKSNASSNKKTKQNPKLLNITQNCYGTFDWMKKQSKKKDSNFFGRSKRFITQSKYDKKPSPSTYKFNNNWLSKTNLLSVTCASTNNFKSVYYH